MRILVALVFSLFVMVTEGAVYKCEVKGRLEFSQTPCGDNAEEINVRYQTPDAAELQHAVATGSTTDSRSIKADLVILDRKIRAKEQDIRKYQRLQEAEMAKLQRKKAFANNNLAGATWEQSISTEMVAIAEKYSARIEVAQAELKALQEQRQILISGQ